MRLDIGWKDIFAAARYCLSPMKRSQVLRKSKNTWSTSNDFIITLSVRSSFDLLLRSLKLPAGSEILISALTVPDMIEIIHAHGLKPIPIDTDQYGAISSEALECSITTESRMFIFAHLFGATQSIDDSINVAKSNGLYIVEDCAQSFSRTGEHGHPLTDAAMFSFGPIKTATALGGSVVRVSSGEIRNRMENILALDPIQSRRYFFRRVCQFGLLKLLSNKHVSSALMLVAGKLGSDFDAFMNKLGRGFNSERILPEIRHQPSSPLVQLLGRRWRNYDFSRIQKRTELGRQLDKKIGQARSHPSTYWIYPIYVTDPIKARSHFLSKGFDATSKSRMTTVPAVREKRIASTAEKLWDHILFLPWYPDLTMEAVEELADLILSIELLSPHDLGGSE